MTVRITLHTATYAPFELYADDRERLTDTTETLSFDTARECADYLTRCGLQSPSVCSPAGHPDYQRAWLGEVDPYEHPATGVLTECSAHNDGTHPRVWAAIVAAVRFPGH